MARNRSPSAAIPVRTLPFTILLLFLAVSYISYVYIRSYYTAKTSNVHPQHHSHSGSTPIVHHDHLNSKNRIVLENMKQGTPRSVWWTNQTAGEPVIEGFTNEFSYLPGEDVLFKLHSEELLLRSSVARYVHPDDPVQVCTFCCCCCYCCCCYYCFFRLSHPLIPSSTPITPAAGVDISSWLLQRQRCHPGGQSVLSRVPSHIPSTTLLFDERYPC